MTTNSAAASAGAAGLAALLDKQVDDQARVATYHAHVQVAQAEMHAQAQILAPLAPDVSRLLDIQA